MLFLHLQIEDPAVEAVSFQKFVVGAPLENAAVIEDQDLVRQHQGRHPVGDEDHRRGGGAAFEVDFENIASIIAHEKLNCT